MSHQHQPQPQKPSTNRPHEPITYGDVFHVHGELAEKPITPSDAAMMQRAETALLGHTQRGGAAALMQSAASWNARTGAFSSREAGRGSDSNPEDSKSESPSNKEVTRRVAEGEAGAESAIASRLNQETTERNDTSDN